MKFVFFTDVHFTSRAPSFRKDNFPETVLKKIEWVGNYAKEIGAYALCGGDLFDTPGVSNSTIGAMLRVINKNFNGIYSICGNHDLYGNNSYNVEKTGIGVLFASGEVINIPYQGHLFDGEKKYKVRVIGVESKIGLDDTYENYLLSDLEKPDDEIWIMIVHGMLYKKQSTLIKSVGVDQILNTKADIVLSGHEHLGFAPIKENGKIFANPGALSRLTTSKSDVNLEVKVAVIDIDEDTGKFSVEFVNVPNNIALPAEEVLDLDRAYEEKRSQVESEKFLTEINSVNTLCIKDPEEILQRFIQEMNLSDKTVEIIRSQLKRAEEEIKNEDIDEDSY